MCVSVFVCECQGGGDVFLTASSSSFAFAVETRQPDLFSFLLEKGKGLFFSAYFCTVGCIFSHTYMYLGAHEMQRNIAREWDVEWLTIRMFLPGRLL